MFSIIKTCSDSDSDLSNEWCIPGYFSCFSRYACGHDEYSVVRPLFLIFGQNKKQRDWIGLDWIGCDLMRIILILFPLLLSLLSCERG